MSTFRAFLCGNLGFAMSDSDSLPAVVFCSELSLRAAFTAPAILSKCHCSTRGHVVRRLRNVCQRYPQWQAAPLRKMPVSATSPNLSPEFDMPTSSAPRGQKLPPNLVETAHAAADAAGKILRSYFREPVPTDFKGDDSPVTKADKEAEEAIRQIIHKTFPDHLVIGEEGGGREAITYDEESAAGYIWVIDPIDGTRAFLCGRATFATLIAVLRDGIAVLGVIDQPISRERWLGIEGVQTTLNGKPVRVRQRSPLSACILQATTPEMFTGIDSITFRKLSHLARNVVYGGDCYAYAMLASGCGDVVVEADLKIWDFLALITVVEGAGGMMSDWIGAPLGLWSDGRVVASASNTVHEEVLQALDATSEIGLNRELTPVSQDPACPSELPEDPGPCCVQSMTGFGRAIVSENGYTVTAIIRSVNGRFCEVQVRGGALMVPFETELAQIVKKRAVRGNLTVTLDIEGVTTSQTRRIEVSADTAAAREARAVLDEIALAARVDGPTLSDVLKFSQVLRKPENDSVGEDVLPAAKKAVTEAVDDLCVWRRREGAVLEEDLLKRLRKISKVITDIEQRASGRVEAERARLRKVINTLLPDGFGEQRLETELALFANKVDFSEELVRLQSHVQLFQLAFLGAGEPIGQRLGFLVQEMNREANTLAAKASDAPISQLVVLVKEEIEKIREQALNIR